MYVLKGGLHVYNNGSFVSAVSELRDCGLWELLRQLLMAGVSGLLKKPRLYCIMKKCRNGHLYVYLCRYNI